MMNPSMILIIAFSVVAQVQLSLSIDLNIHTIADAEAARKAANASLVELEYYAENLMKGFNKSGAVNDTMHSIADPVENGIAEKTSDAMPSNYNTHTFVGVALILACVMVGVAMGFSLQALWKKHTTMSPFSISTKPLLG